MLKYVVRTSVLFDCGFDVTVDDVMKSVHQTNERLSMLPWNVYTSVDLKTISSMVGAFFCKGIEDHTSGIVNPIEKGHPDVVPPDAATASEEQLRNYPYGLEVKVTVGNVEQGSNLAAGQTRISKITSITWQAHHREVDKLLGLVWDFVQRDGLPYAYPAITGVFYTTELTQTDWGAISGTEGRNTKVSGMRSSGKLKMGRGWVAVLDRPEYIAKYSRILQFQLQ
jgi:hypothetical protein